MILTTSNHYLPEAFDNDVKRYLELNELIKDIAAEQSSIKTRIRALGSGVHPAPCGVEVSVTPQRRFNPDRAAEVVPPELLTLIMTTAIDSKKAKALLPPALYEAAQVQSGEPRVAFR